MWLEIESKWAPPYGDWFDSIWGWLEVPFWRVFFLTQFFQISKYLRNLAGRRILEGHNAKFTSVWPVYFKSHGVSISLTRLSQRNTNLRLLFNIYKTRKKPSQPIIGKFRAISGILCVLCIFVVLYVKFC